RRCASRLATLGKLSHYNRSSMNVLDLDRQLNELIIQGKSMDAFVRYYAEDVVAQENDEAERVGRAPWMQARKDMEKSIRKFHAKVLATAVQGDTSFSEWEYDVEIEGMGPIAMAQVSVRRWKDGRVVNEVSPWTAVARTFAWNFR